MKKLIVTSLCALVALCILAQSPLAPQPVDYRYSLTWDDPNPLGSVSNWVVTALGPTNVITKTVTTRLISYSDLLANQESSIFYITVAPVSVTGLIGESSTNHVVLYQRRLHGPKNLSSGK